MNAINSLSRNYSEPGLEQVIEPLASYICAADRPKAVLSRVVAALLNEVEQTNRVAKSHVASRTFAGFSN
jgi:hypothetical protein